MRGKKLPSKNSAAVEDGKGYGVGNEKRIKRKNEGEKMGCRKTEEVKKRQNVIK